MMLSTSLKITENIQFLPESVTKRIKIQKEFLIYLDSKEILKELHISALSYNKICENFIKKGNFIPPFRFKLMLDLMKMQEISGNLFDLFVKEPKSGFDLATNVVFCGVNLILPDLELNKSDVQVIPIVINLPVTCEISDLYLCPSLGLESVQGVLMSKTTITKYTRSSVYYCDLNYCPSNKWQRYPGHFGNVCPHCLNIMEEDVLSSDTGEEFICCLIPLKALQTPGRFQVLNVKVKDELCTLTEFFIGEEYKVIGKIHGNYFEALNIEHENKLPFFNDLPRSILDLHHKVSAVAPNCPWSFVGALASSLASHLIPVSSYLHLKMGLMLSLASQKSDEPPTPLVAIGPDSLNSKILFKHAGKLAERYVEYSTGHTYLGGTAKLGLQPDTIWLEAGQLILASKGICNIGDWTKLKKEQANYTCQTIESGQIVLSKTNLVDFLPLKCSIWTYWCHITTSRNHQLQLKTLMNVFGIFFLAEEKNELEMEKICWKNLGMTDENVANDQTDLKLFIKIINTKEMSLTDEASQLIRNYFVVTRRDRPHCLPIGAIKTITSLAEAHARLALRDEVLYEDAVAVIFLYEESISVLFGESINPYPLIWDQKEPIFVFMSKRLQQFKTQLEKYILT